MMPALASAGEEEEEVDPAIEGGDREWKKAIKMLKLGSGLAVGCGVERQDTRASSTRDPGGSGNRKQSSLKYTGSACTVHQVALLLVRESLPGVTSVTVSSVEEEDTRDHQSASRHVHDCASHKESTSKYQAQ